MSKKLRRCLGWGETEGWCTNDADSRRTPYWCQSCDDQRCEYIGHNLRALAEGRPQDCREVPTRRRRP